MKFVVFQVAGGRWDWEFRGADGVPVARCVMGFSTRQAAVQDIHRLRTRAAGSAIFDPLGNLVIGEPATVPDALGSPTPRK